MSRIKSLEKEDRKDISNYIATLEDGSTISVEAKSKSEAEKLVEDFLNTDDGKVLHPKPTKKEKKAS